MQRLGRGQWRVLPKWLGSAMIAVALGSKTRPSLHLRCRRFGGRRGPRPGWSLCCFAGGCICRIRPTWAMASARGRRGREWFRGSPRSARLPLPPLLMSRLCRGGVGTRGNGFATRKNDEGVLGELSEMESRSRFWLLPAQPAKPNPDRGQTWLSIWGPLAPRG